MINEANMISKANMIHEVNMIKRHLVFSDGKGIIDAVFIAHYGKWHYSKMAQKGR